MSSIRTALASIGPDREPVSRTVRVPESIATVARSFQIHVPAVVARPVGQIHRGNRLIARSRADQCRPVIDAGTRPPSSSYRRTNPGRRDPVRPRRQPVAVQVADEAGGWLVTDRGPSLSAEGQGERAPRGVAGGSSTC